MDPSQNQMAGVAQGQLPPNAGNGAIAPQQQQQHQPHPLYIPEQIKQMAGLTAEERQKYAAGLDTLWRKVKTTPPESTEHQQARDKIMNFSKMLSVKLRDKKDKDDKEKAEKDKADLQQRQPGAGAAAPQHVQPAQKQVGQAQPNAQQTPSQQQQQQRLAQTAQTQGQTAPNNANSAAQTQDGGSTETQVQNPTQQQQAQALAQTQKIPENIANHLRSLTFKPQPALLDKSPAEQQKWITDMKSKYGRALFSIENNRVKIKAIEKQLAARQQSGNPMTDEELKKQNDQKALHVKHFTDASRWAETFRRQNLVTDAGGANTAGQRPDAARPNTQATPQNITQSNNTNSNPAGAMNAPSDASKMQPQQTPVSAARQPQAGDGSANAQVPQPPAPSTVAPPQPTQAQIQAAQRAQQAQQAQQAPQPPAVKAHPGQQQTPVPPPNQGARMNQTPQASTPVNPPGQTQALSHSAAMAMANQANQANQRASVASGPSQGQQHAGTPSSAGVAPGQHPVSQPTQQTQQQQHLAPQQQHGHSHAHPTQQQPTMQSKMPIPKVLPEKATAVPQGVTLGGGIKAGRPTVSQGSGTLGGVMNQPAINRIPAFTNEAEGDHVLSKKKLDELVRQVCASSSEGQESNLLTPEVEENVLNMADSFVDNVLQVACRNAKERGSKVLEIRDIQLVLERTYNIRVPGYSSDELRTVRKVQPSAGWIAKMSAVQAAKVMPGKGE